MRSSYLFALQRAKRSCNVRGRNPVESHLMLMFAVAFVSGAEMTSRSDLGTSAADLTAATTTRVIGVAADAGHLRSFWSARPSRPQEITVEVGTKLVFMWKGGYDVVITGKDVWDTCVSTWHLNRGLTVHRPTLVPSAKCQVPSAMCSPLPS